MVILSNKIMQNYPKITQKRGKGILPWFCGNVEWVISIYFGRQDQNSDTVQQPPPYRDTCWIERQIPRLAPNGCSRHPRNQNAAMVKYNIATIEVMVGANPASPIDKIHNRKTFSTLWHLQHQLVNGLQK